MDIDWVNNGHASESKCTYFYFMAGENRKYVNHEIFINLKLLYRQKQSVENVP